MEDTLHGPDGNKPGKKLGEGEVRQSQDFGGTPEKPGSDGAVYDALIEALEQENSHE